ncbi:MAG TPA: cytochrome c [Actinomycetota bacterium]|nr:cytochrome c [Actinomycetota bacterium]
MAARLQRSPIVKTNRLPVVLIPAVLAFLAMGCAPSSSSRTPPGQSPQEGQLARAVSAPSRLQPPEHLPEAARAVLRTIMGSHVHAMSDLVSAIMVLDYPRIESAAQAVASDDSLSRPLTGDATELNSLLPEKFFQNQDDLRRQAHEVALAARSQGASAVAAAYGKLAEACVRCHATYRQGGR